MRGGSEIDNMGSECDRYFQVSQVSATVTCPSFLQANVKELMARALEMESQHWAQDVAPLRLDGHCHSELAIDIIQVPWSVLWVYGAHCTHPACACASRTTSPCS